VPEDYHRAPMVRLPSEHAAWTRTHAAQGKRTIGAVVAQALAEYRARQEAQPVTEYLDRHKKPEEGK
jgi:hypothetical protein